MPNRIARIGAVAAGAVLAGTGMVATTQIPSYASTIVRGPGVSGHAGYVHSTNHGWVCDDRSDGRQVYAVWTFHGAIGDTTYRSNAPAHGHGCKGNWFSKYPTSVKVCINYPHRVDECGRKVDL